jgi:hypothetical protein
MPLEMVLVTLPPSSMAPGAWEVHGEVFAGVGWRRWVARWVVFEAELLQPCDRLVTAGEPCDRPNVIVTAPMFEQHPPRNSKMAAMTTADQSLRVLEPTEVAKALATSLAPMPAAGRGWVQWSGVKGVRVRVERQGAGASASAMREGGREEGEGGRHPSRPPRASHRRRPATPQRRG